MNTKIVSQFYFILFYFIFCLAHVGHGFVTYSLLVYGIVIDICRVKMILCGHFYNSKLL